MNTVNLSITFTVVALAVMVTILSTNMYPITGSTDAKSIQDIIANWENIWNYYKPCDVDVQLNEIVPTALKVRYPFDVKLALPTYIPEGYRLVAVDWLIDGPDTPYGWVKMIYWNKGDCDELYKEGENKAYAVHGAFAYIIHLPMEKGPVQKGMNDAGVDQALTDYQSRKGSIRAQMQEVRLSNGYRAVGWEPFMGVEGMAIPRCPEYEDRSVMEISIDDADNVTCRYDDGTAAEGSITYTGEGPQAGMITYLHEEYNLGIIVRGGLPLDELAKIAGSVKVLE